MQLLEGDTSTPSASKLPALQQDDIVAELGDDLRTEIGGDRESDLGRSA